MKKIINGKLYDTDKAKEHGNFEFSYRNNFDWYSETLFRKRTGEFFIFGEGNAASKYRRSCGQNEWCGGKWIIPLTYAEAQIWAEEKLDSDEYVAIFGEPEESGKYDLHIQISVSKAATLKQQATKAGQSIAAYIESLIP